MRLLERDRQLGDLHRALERARQGRGTTVLVSGEAGIGKTWLIRAFTAQIAGETRVFLGTCEDLLTARPLGPFRDMAGVVGMGLTGLGSDDRDGFIDALLERMRFSHQPAVVIVEDAHWADDASLDIIRYLARRIEQLPAMLVVSYRDEELNPGHPLRGIIGVLAGSACLHLELEGLSDTVVTQLAESVGLEPGPVVAAVGGNPFFLTEVLAAPGKAIPPSVRHAVLARFASLPVPCRSVLQQLSVVPAEVEGWLVAALLDDPSLLEPAERRGMVVVEQGRLRFRHELARRVIERSLTPLERMACHSRVLAVLVEADAEPSRLAHHAMGAGDGPAVARHAAHSARQAARAEAHREVVAFARMALQHDPQLDPLEAAELHSLAATALYAVNRFGEAAEHADRAVAIWESSSSAPAQLGQALLISARMATLMADPASARAKALRALAVLEPLGPSGSLALCYSTLGSQDAVRAGFEAAETWTTRAVELARRVGRTEVAAHALGYRGVSRVSLGDAAGFADLREAVKLAAELDHGDYLTVATHNLAVMLIRSGRALEATPYLALGERAAREHGLDHALYRIEAQQCHVLLLRGAWDEAERRLDSLVSRADDPGANLVNPLAFLGRIRVRRGDPQADDLIDRAWTLACATGEDQKLAVAGGARIERAWLRGDVGAVRAIGAELLPTATRASHALLRGEVLRYLRRVGERVEPFPGCPEPLAAGIRGDWRTAAALWQAAGNPYEEALELTESVPPTESAVGREALEGLEILDRLGAAATARLVRRRLQRLGVPGVPRGPSATTRANPGRLTARQLDVLALLADGLTNAEIATRFYVSRRTVDNHVAAVLARLGVDSRGAAVATATSLGLLPGPRTDGRGPAPGAET